MTSERIEQINLQRAKSALDCVRGVRDEPDADRRAKLRADYLNAVEAFPFAARSLGLGQALALLAAGGAKDGGRQHPGHRQLYADLQSWLCQKQEHSPYYKKCDNDLLKALTEGDQADYRTALVETEAYFAWLKPLAQALLSEPTAAATDTAG